jgi:hypothetical protein
METIAADMLVKLSEIKKDYDDDPRHRREGL